MSVYNQFLVHNFQLKILCMKAKIYRQYVLWIENLKNGDIIGIFLDWDMYYVRSIDWKFTLFKCISQSSNFETVFVYWESAEPCGLHWVQLWKCPASSAVYSNILKLKNLKSEVSKAIEILISGHFGHPGFWPKQCPKK